jgi:hypothetical protein
MDKLSLQGISRKAPSGPLMFPSLTRPQDVPLEYLSENNVTLVPQSPLPSYYCVHPKKLGQVLHRHNPSGQTLFLM